MRHVIVMRCQPVDSCVVMLGWLVGWLVGWLYVASARVQNAERVCVHAVQQGHTSGAQPTNQPSITTHVKRKEEMEEAQSGKRTCG